MAADTNVIAFAASTPQPVPGARTAEMQIITPEIVKSWLAPGFQRPLCVNAKVHSVAEQLQATREMPGTPLQLGRYEGQVYKIDGQHRVAALLLSGLPEVLACVETTQYASGLDGYQAMSDDYIRYNSQLKPLQADDLLRAFESLSPPLQFIRTCCPFVGYDRVRHNSTSAPVLSMAVTLRTWASSAREIPGGNSSSGITNARNLTFDDAKALTDFLHLAFSAWGREYENRRLWSALNLTLCMWLYRNLVLVQYSARTPLLPPDLFEKCLMSVGAKAAYSDWLVGRNVSERDRSPAYVKLKAIFVHRIQLETGKRPLLPAPAWASNAGQRLGV